MTAPAAAIDTAPAPVTASPPPRVPLLEAETRLDIQANDIEYSSDRFELIAVGDVDVRASDGSSLRANYLAFDLKANRYLAAGAVHVIVGDRTLDGAALSNFLNFNRVYFLPSLTTPDRVTYLDGNFHDAQAGREMPGDAFAFPAPLRGRARVKTRLATIYPHHYVRFGPSMLDTNVTVIPVPNFVVDISNNPNFAQNSLAGASFDASYPFAASTRSQTAAHIRAGGGNGIFGAVEERFAWQKSYLVGSISPINHSLKQYNVLGERSLSPTLQIQGFSQTQAFQRGFSQPLNASEMLTLRLTQALSRSYLQLNATQYYQSLLGDPENGGPGGCECYGDVSHLFVPNHPINMQLSWIGFDHQISHLPLKYRLRSGFGYDHDAYGINPPSSLSPGLLSYTSIAPQYGSLVGVGVQNVTNSLLGATVYAPSIRLNRDHHGNDTTLNLSVDKQRQWYSIPHHIDTTTGTVSIGKTYGSHLAAFISYNVTQTGDDYGANQRNVYPSAVITSPQTGLAYPGFASFDGFETLRGITESLIYTPHPEFNASLSVKETDDFPRAVPGIIGEAPTIITGEVRARLRPHLTVDIARSYYFNFGTQHYSPTFTLLFGE